MGLHEQMLRIRSVEKEIARRYPDGKMRTPVHLSIGQEFAAVGVCSALGSDDLVVSTHRSHAHYLAKGGNLNAFIAELHGKATGCSGGFGGSMHLVDRAAGFYGSTSIVGGTIPVGVGLAFSKVYKGQPGIVVIFHGDAAVEEGVWHESVNFAVLHKLPVLFVCENNGYSCYTPLNQRQPREDFRALSIGHGLNYFANRRRRVADVHRAMKFLMFRQAWPALLEIRCERWMEHCGVKQEIKGKDEITGRGDIEIEAEIEEAFRLAEEAPWPKPMSMYANQDNR